MKIFKLEKLNKPSYSLEERVKGRKCKQSCIEAMQCYGMLNIALHNYQ